MHKRHLKRPQFSLWSLLYLVLITQVCLITLPALGVCTTTDVTVAAAGVCVLFLGIGIILERNGPYHPPVKTRHSETGGYGCPYCGHVTETRKAFPVCPSCSKQTKSRGPTVSAMLLASIIFAFFVLAFVQALVSTPAE